MRRGVRGGRVTSISGDTHGGREDGARAASVVVGAVKIEGDAATGVIAAAERSGVRDASAEDDAIGGLGREGRRGCRTGSRRRRGRRRRLGAHRDGFVGIVASAAHPGIIVIPAVGGDPLISARLSRSVGIGGVTSIARDTHLGSENGVGAAGVVVRSVEIEDNAASRLETAAEGGGIRDASPEDNAIGGLGREGQTGCPKTRRRIVEFRTRERAGVAIPACDQNLAVGQQRLGVEITSIRKAAGL